MRGLTTGMVLLPFLMLSPVRAKENDFFETKIRPVLAEHCWKCHGSEKQRGGLRLDGPDHFKKDDGSGSVLVPGKPEESLLIKAIRHEGDYPMPPKGKLAESEIAALTRWVQEGATWPKAITPKSDTSKTHWAFQPVAVPKIPPIEHPLWKNNPVDCFIFQTLQAKKLSPSLPTDKRTWIRRVTFDLIGLPPTPEEVDAFVKDQAIDAYAKVIDRLLESPHYGERWGRHWLDLARYSDTKGYLFGQDTRFPFAYTYRDWVIRAFNQDLPYDQFLQKQIAADALVEENKNDDLAALGFLALGRRFEEYEPDIIDDRMDVIFRTTQGLSISCARCHDHKYDPIPTKDYYSLYGVFAGMGEKEIPLIRNQEEEAKYQVYAKELRKRVREFSQFVELEKRKLLGDYTRLAGAYFWAAHTGDGEAKEEEPRKDGLHQLLVNQWKEFLMNTSQEEFHRLMTPWHEFVKLPTKDFKTEAPKLARKFAANKEEGKELNPLIAHLFRGPTPRSLKEVSDRYGKLFGRIQRQWHKQVQEADLEDRELPTRLEDEDAEEIRELFFGEYPPLNISDGNLVNILDAELQPRFEELQKQIGDWKTGPNAFPHTLILTDPDEPITPNVFIRGKPEQLGPEVPRQFLQVLTGPDRQPFPNGTGRLDLAKAITDRKNPLTARVWVNRVWEHHFGKGLVQTPSDFGTRSDAPSHPELLDFLAHWFMENGWSTKKLHRLLLLSQTYQQSSQDRPEARKIDPENQLLWRMNRQRLEWEPLRDAMLAVAGNLDRQIGGRSISLNDEPLNGRRTLYQLVDRENLLGLFRNFDFANPDMHSPKRHETTVPQQALFLLNSPFVAEQSRKLAERLDGMNLASDSDWIQQLYPLLLARSATTQEIHRAETFLHMARKLGEQGPETRSSIWKYGHAKWDAKQKKLIDFQPLEQFKDGNWQPGLELPDPKLNYLFLNAEGGHPGNSLDQVVVRRWVAPKAGILSVDGTLKHKLDEKNEDADGVHGQIVHSRQGILLETIASNAEKPTRLDTISVKAGDTIDFVIDCRSNDVLDTFSWVVTMTLKPSAKTMEETFQSDDDFQGPTEPSKPLTPKQKLVQVLMMSNEFIFVD